MSGREEKDMADPQAAVVNSTTDQPPATNTGFLRHQYRCCTQSCHFDLKCDSDSEKKRYIAWNRFWVCNWSQNHF